MYLTEGASFFVDSNIFYHNVFKFFEHIINNFSYIVGRYANNFLKTIDSLYTYYINYANKLRIKYSIINDLNRDDYRYYSDDFIPNESININKKAGINLNRILKGVISCYTTSLLNNSTIAQNENEYKDYYYNIIEKNNKFDYDDIYNSFNEVIKDISYKERKHIIIIDKNNFDKIKSKLYFNNFEIDIYSINNNYNYLNSIKN